MSRGLVGRRGASVVEKVIILALLVLATLLFLWPNIRQKQLKGGGFMVHCFRILRPWLLGLCVWAGHHGGGSMWQRTVNSR